MAVLRELKKSVLSIALPVLVVALGACTGARDEGRIVASPPLEATKDTAVTVGVAPVVQGDLPITATGRGRVLPSDQRRLVAPFGARIQEVNLESGDEVRAGEVLLRLDTSDLEAELQEAKDELLAAEYRLATELVYVEPADEAPQQDQETRDLQQRLAELDVRYIQGLVETEAYEQLSTDLRLRLIGRGAFASDYREIQSGARKARRRVARILQQIGAAEIESPVAGLVEMEDLDVGERVRADMALARIYVFHPAIARVSLIEEDLRRVRVGQRAVVRVGISGDLAVEGRVSRILPSRTSDGDYHIDISFEPGDRQIVSGLFAEADITVDVLLDRLLVPVNALLREGERYYVFVVSDGLAWWRWVDVGIRSGDTVEVQRNPFVPSPNTERIHGVDPGETVAVAGHTLLGHRVRVTVERDEQR